MSKTVIDAAKPLSQSVLWDLQRRYFDNQGVQAWSGYIPFYVTSNPFIANTYAQNIFALIKDRLAESPDTIKHPFYIIELGTGPGQFSFYLVKRLLELKAQLQLDQLVLRYVMTDFTQENINYWKQHPALAEFIEQGVLDFAVYNLEQAQTIHCQQSGVTLSKGSLKNPLCLIANYLFDCISHDCFTISDGELFASWVSVHIDEKKGESKAQNLSLNIDKLSKEHHTRPLQQPYYPEQIFNDILMDYTDKLMDTHLLFPIAALRALMTLREFSSKLLLLVSDKGYTKLDALDNLDYPHLEIHHGCFSVMVNMHAISEYFKRTQGDAFFPEDRDGINVGVFSSGFTLDQMTRLSAQVKRGIDGFNPADFLNVFHHVSASVDKADIKALVSYLNLSGWDPYFFHYVQSAICDKIEDTEHDTKSYLTQHLPDIANNFYYLPDAYDTYFEVALTFHALQKYADALTYYLKSADFFQEQFELYYNIGLCHYYLSDYPQALINFNLALKLQPKSVEAQEWIDRLS